MNPEQTDNQLQQAMLLLGRAPRTPYIVKTFCPDGSPQVLLADPVFIEDGIWKPFPAFLWLVCPRLKALVADKEQQGLIREFSRRLENDDDFRREFLSGQRIISSIRLEMAQKIYPGELPQHIREILDETTVAGSKDFRGVKCLHSHVAHELAFGNNPVGAETLRLIGRCDIDSICGKSLTTRSET
jgi:hypothetical protein